MSITLWAVGGTEGQYINCMINLFKFKVFRCYLQSPCESSANGLISTIVASFD